MALAWFRPCYISHYFILSHNLSEPNVHVLASDLLRIDAPQQTCSSRKFLLGTAAVMVEFCADALWQRYHDRGSSSFDPLFLIQNDSGTLVDDEPTLLPSKGWDEDRIFEPKVFAGMTEFFFLSAALLRVALFPGFRAQQQLLREHAQLHESVRKIGQKFEGSEIPENFFDEKVKRSIDAMLGWETLLRDPELLRTVTKLSILQLKWLASVAEEKLFVQGNKQADSVCYVIPEWFCKLPAEWISFVASRAPSTLSVVDGEVAVEVATRLLHIGTEFPGQSFSPTVITELIRIPGAFVRAGVARAKSLMAAKHAKSLRGKAIDERRSAIQDYIVDERSCDFDIALDRNGLGTTAFTNSYVQTRLSSTLLLTYSALDAVEGVNVEREHAFDKFHVKGEVTELLLRLWNHPCGGAKYAVTNCPQEDLSAFVTSLASAIGLQMDDSCLKLLDVREILKKSRSRTLSSKDAQYYEYMSKAVASGFAGARKQLRLLMYVIESDKVAAMLGGPVEATSLPVTKAVANLFLALLERLASEDGRISTELDFRGVLRSEVRSTDFLWLEFGLDIGVMVHYMLAFAARLHAAATKTSTCNEHSSFFVEVVGKNEDCTVEKLRGVFANLVDVNDVPLSSDGIRSRNIDKNRQWSIAQDQFSHETVDNIASLDEISNFIDAVQASKAKYEAISNAASNTSELEKSITECEDALEDDLYTECLGDWVFSSEPFGTTSGKLDHFYDSLARKRTHSVSAKLLQNEAKKTKRLLPSPLASAAVFVCFAEERMDVCKAITTGSESTPYSLGLFLFDLFFPATYPSVPPLITFLTTGKSTMQNLRKRRRSTLTHWNYFNMQ